MERQLYGRYLPVFGQLDFDMIWAQAGEMRQAILDEIEDAVPSRLHPAQ